MPAAVVLSVLLALPALAMADPATPQRPSFSSDPNTTAPGTLELEAGYLHADDDTGELPLTLKWGSGERTELYVGWSPWFQSAGENKYIGDTTIGVRHRFVDASEGPVALAYQLAAQIPTSDPEDSGGADVIDAYFALTSAWSMGRWNAVGFYQFGALGRAGGGGVSAENALSFVLGTSLSTRWSAFGEWTSVWQPERDQFQSLAMLGAGFALRPSLVLDTAVALALVPGEDLWSGTVGATFNFGWPG